jgi:hypothetical protein
MKVALFIYVFVFMGLIKAHAYNFNEIKQQQPKDCVKHPQIIKHNSVEKPATIITTKPEKVVKTSSVKSINLLTNFSVFNFINFFYTKDTLDNLRVM